jgi:hypothetical protein
MRWQLDFQGKFDRYVDADELRAAPHGGHQFVCVTSKGSGFAAVLTIAWQAAPYFRIRRVPTFRMVGGPRDGQVCAAPDRVPRCIHFQHVVALGEDGETLAPIAPGRLRELNDIYVHHPLDCPCHGSMGGLVEHVYVWPETLYEQIGTRSEVGADARA